MTLDVDYWTALANDYAAAAPGALGHQPSRWALVLACSVAEHETNNGRAWPGAWNFGAVQLRELTAAEQAAFAAGQLHAGDYTRDTHRADVPRGILQVDTHPGPSGPVRYGVWFAAFNSRVQGIAFFLRTLWRLTNLTTEPRAAASVADAHAHDAPLDPAHTYAPEAADATCSSVAEAMYRHGYFEGARHGARPVGARIGALTTPEQANVDDYATAMARIVTGTLGPMLDGWGPPWGLPQSVAAEQRNEVVTASAPVIERG